MRTSEIHAYNYGQRAREAGVPVSQLAPSDEDQRGPDLDSAELDSLIQLGPDGFDRWAIKGWIEADINAAEQ